MVVGDHGWHDVSPQGGQVVAPARRAERVSCCHSPYGWVTARRHRAPLGENSPDRATETYDRSPSRTQLSW